MKGLRRLDPLENAIESAVCEYFAYCGFGFWKQPQSGYYDEKLGKFRKHTSPYVANGVSDLLVVRNGRLICVEIKTQKGRQSADQIKFEHFIRQTGALYFVCRSLDDAQNIARVIKSL